MKPPKGAGERVYPNGRMDVGTGPKPTAAERLAAEVAAMYPPSPVPQYAKIHDIDDDARWQAEEDDELIARKTPAPRIVEPGSIDSTDLAARDRPSAADAHAADLVEMLKRANASNARMVESLARHEDERRVWAAKLAEAQRPRRHDTLSSILTLLRGDR